MYANACTACTRLVPALPYVCENVSSTKTATLRFINAQKKVVSTTKPCYRIRIKKKNEQDDTEVHLQ